MVGRTIPFCSTPTQDLGQAVHGPQIAAQRVVQPLIVNARLGLCICQGSLTLDHALGEPAVPKPSVGGAFTQP